MQIYYILNVDEDYLYAHKYETIQEAKEIIREYESQDIKERDRLQQYHVLDSECNPVWDSLKQADRLAAQYIKKTYFSHLY